jgi:hypothetical protein
MKQKILLFSLLIFSVICVIIVLSISSKETKDTTDTHLKKQLKESGVEVEPISYIDEKWSVNCLINLEFNEYILRPPHYSMGEIIITLNSDGTFRNGGCAGETDGDCIEITGRYKILDNRYIHFYIESIKENIGPSITLYKPEKKSGLYYIKKEQDKVRLFKSIGDIEQDELNVAYSTLIDTFNIQQNRFFPPFFFYDTYTTPAIKINKEDPKEAVSLYMSELGIKDYQYLYSKDWDYGYSSYNPKVILIKINNNFRYIIWNGKDKSMRLYDDTKIKEIDKIVKEFKDNEYLKPIIWWEEPDNPETQVKKKISVYKKENNQIATIICHESFSLEQSRNTIMYLKDEQLVYVEIEVKYRDGIVSNVFYVEDWENDKTKYVMRRDGLRRFDSNTYARLIELSKKMTLNE